MPDPIPTGGAETGASSFNLGPAAEVALRHSAGMPADAVRGVVEESNLNQGVALTPEQRAKNEIKTEKSSDIELLGTFNLSLSTCLGEAAVIHQTYIDASAKSLEAAQRISALKQKEAAQLQESNAEETRASYLGSAIFHYESAITGISLIIETPEATRKSLSDSLQIPRQTLELFKLSTANDLLGLSTQALEGLLNLAKDASRSLKEQQNAARERSLQHADESVLTRSLTITEQAVREAYDALGEETMATVNKIASEARAANEANLAFEKALSAQEEAKTKILQEFGPTVLVDSAALSRSIDILGGIGLAGNNQESINFLKSQIAFKEGYLRLLTTDTNGETTNNALPEEEVRTLNAEIETLRQDLAKAEEIARQVAVSPGDVLSKFGIDKRNLTAEQSARLSTLLGELSTTMEAKGEARRNLEAAIRQLDQTTEKAKQYNAAMTKAMEETRADIEKLKAEAAAAEAQARAEALAETERQAAAEASSQNVDNLSQLAIELQNRQIALEQRLDEVNRENATLRQAANETLAQTAGRMATAFLKKHNRRIPPFLSKYNY